MDMFPSQHFYERPYAQPQRRLTPGFSQNKPRKETAGGGAIIVGFQTSVTAMSSSMSLAGTDICGKGGRGA